MFANLQAQTINTDFNEFPNNGYVTCIKYTENFVYIGGSFTSVGVHPISKVARYFSNTGTIDTSWHPMPNHDVRAIAIKGNDIYLAGAFSRIGDVERKNIAKVSSNSVLDAQWYPKISGFDGRSTIVNQIAINEGFLYIGGVFDSVNSVSSENIARVSLTGAGETDFDWIHFLGGSVFDFAFTDSDVYITGAFSYVNNFDIHNLTKISLHGGGVDSLWKPNPSSLVFSAQIFNNMLYVSGGFGAFGVTFYFEDGMWKYSGGYPISTFARVELGGTGRADTTWKTNPNGQVSSFAISDSNIYVGGAFTQIGGGNHAGLAKLSLNGIADNSWNTEVNGGIIYNAFEYDKTLSRLYFGGYFTLPSNNLGIINDNQKIINPNIYLTAGSLNGDDNTPVSFWLDNMGADNNAEQTLPQRKPKYRTHSSFTINGNPVVEFGQDKGMSIQGSTEVSGGISKTIFAVIRTGNEVVSRQVIFEMGGVASGFNIYIQGFQLYAGAWNSTNAWHASRQILSNRTYLVQFTYNGSKMRLSINGINGEVSSVNYTVNFSSPTILGTNNDIGVGAVIDQTRFHNIPYNGAFGDSFKGQIAEIMVLNTTDANERNQVFTAFNNKYKFGALMQPLPKQNDDENIVSTETTIQSELFTYPNPSSDYTKFQCPENIKELFIYSLQGEILHHETSINNRHITIRTDSYPSGRYGVTTHTESGMYHSLLTIVK